MTGKMIIISAPSGAGKTTIVKCITENIPSLGFSISATSRAPRKGEIHGKDYYFLSAADFTDRISRGDFIEWEEVYNGYYYGTLKSEVERIWAENRNIIFDVDVKGGITLKNIYGDKALSVFIMPPSISELEKRLRMRGKDSEDKIRMRVSKAAEEITYAGRFDEIIVNDDLKTAQNATVVLVRKFLNQNLQ